MAKRVEEKALFSTDRSTDKPWVGNPPAMEPKPPFILDKATKDDFFRLRRKENGWICQMVRVQDGVVILKTDVYEWDRLEQTERRLIGYAADAERDR